MELASMIIVVKSIDCTSEGMVVSKFWCCLYLHE